MSNLIGESGYARKHLDCYWTRPWVTQWLLDGYGKRLVTYPYQVVWEPACGEGHISRVLSQHGYQVLSTDVFNHGDVNFNAVWNFLNVEEVSDIVTCILTNPPYDIKPESGYPPVTAEQFIRHAIHLMKPNKGKVIMLVRNEFDCAKGRRDLFSRYPFYGKYVLTKRPEWTDEKKASPRHNYAWFVWDWAAPEDRVPTIHMLPDTH